RRGAVRGRMPGVRRSQRLAARRRRGRAGGSVVPRLDRGGVRAGSGARRRDRPPPRSAGGMSLRAWRWVRFSGAAAVLAAIVWRLGAGPFRDGIGAVDARVLAVGLGIGFVTTICCAWRWTVVARGLGIELSLPAAVAAYYRSIFLNLTLPGGVVGDVHRGVRHGRDAGDVGRGLRAVAWERTAGQVVQALLTLAVLLALPSPVRTLVIPIAIGVAGVTIGVGVLVERARPRRSSWWARARSGVARD